MNITTEGQRHLGAVLGSKSFKDQYCEEMVDKWIADLRALCEIARTQPQAAYVSFTKAFKSKFTYFQRTIPSFEQYLEPLQDVINDLFVPAILGQDTPLSDELMACFPQQRRTEHTRPARGYSLSVLLKQADHQCSH